MKKELIEQWQLYCEFLDRLCGNVGYVDTEGRTYSGAGIECGVKRPCICPNGRAIKKALSKSILGYQG